MTEPPAQFDAREALELLELLRAQLLDARERALEDPSAWGGWSVRFNQRLRHDRARLEILVEPRPTASDEHHAAYRAAAALRNLWETMNRAMSGQEADVAAARVELESHITELAHLIRE
ncbi:MAG: hypothetical protein U5Q44_10385 [Dehalococcoidia bacterium]|nr:hypothetical protein [Dehalococcoidia bacterium]